MKEYFTPLPVPSFESLTESPSKELTEHQQELLDKVFAHFTKDDYAISEVEDGELEDEEKYWLSYECMQRFLRAVKWSSAEAAIKRIEGTLRWRREFGLYNLVTPAYVEPEGVTGKQVIFGFDVDARPALYLVPSRQNTEESERQIHFVIFALERVVDLMGPGVETLTLMINFADRGKNPSIGTSRKVLDILQTHYPEHLGRAVIINLPFLINAFFKVITPFVDPVTRPKMKFNPKIVEEGLFTPDQLWKEFGGECDFKYEHDKYWPAFVEMCESKRSAQLKKWKELGGTVGLKDWDVRRGVTVGYSATSSESEKVSEEEAPIMEIVAA
ncbi:CRAL-TRIO lipid binding domain superfamily protein [Abortiporus biennis]